MYSHSGKKLLKSRIRIEEMNLTKKKFTKGKVFENRKLMVNYNPINLISLNNVYILGPKLKIICSDYVFKVNQFTELHNKSNSRIRKLGVWGKCED